MKCVICRSGETSSGDASYSVERDGHTYVVREVPAQVCTQCGEPYFTEEVTMKILEQVEQASKSGADVAVLTYRAA